LNSPPDGCVTTTSLPVKIMPPPTGISAVLASAPAALAVPLASPAALAGAGALLPGALLPGALLPGALLRGALVTGELLEAAPQAVIALARPARPTPAST